jgi:hypothetical protein
MPEVHSGAGLKAMVAIQTTGMSATAQARRMSA